MRRFMARITLFYIAVMVSGTLAAISNSRIRTEPRIVHAAAVAGDPQCFYINGVWVCFGNAY